MVWTDLKTPFHHFPDPQGRPHIRLITNHNFFENLRFKTSKLGKSSVLKPKIWSNFSSKSLKFDRKSVHKDAPTRLNPGGGHWPRKGVWGCAAVMIPFFQATRRSLAYQFIIIAPLYNARHFQILEKFSIFSLVLVKISALKMQIFQIFVP